jgi:hypothetical protein
MANLLPIRNVRAEDVHNVVRQTLRTGLDTDVLEDFLASVDWSDADKHPSEITNLLGELENATTMFCEGDLNEVQYASKLQRILPTGGKVMFTLTHLPQVVRPAPVLDQSSQQPQTGSGAEPVPDVGESRNGIGRELLATH